MRRKAGAKPLDPVHWDYRSITAGEFQVAAHYEYARCCPRIVAYWEKWLKSAIPAVVRMDWGPPVFDKDRRIPVARALADYPRGLALDENPDPVADLLIASFPLSLRRTGLAPLLLRALVFPKPWLDIDPPTRDRLARTVPIGLPRPRAFRDHMYLPSAGAYRFSEIVRCGRKKEPGDADFTVSFEVEIDFSQKLEAIESDFERWLQAKRAALREAGAIPSKFPNSGRSVEINYDALLWLACYNFRDAGISYSAARKMTSARETHFPVASPLVVLPHYSQDSNWSAQAGRAKRLMARLCTPVVNSPLEHTSALVEFRKNWD